MMWSRPYGIELFLLSSVTLSLAMCYPQIFGFFVFIFLLPILFFLDKNRHVDGNRGLFGSMFIFNFICITISTSWFLSVFPLDWLKITDPFLSVLLIIPFWLFFVSGMSALIAFWPVCVLFLRTKFVLVNTLIAASVWVLIEYVRSWVLAFGIHGSETLFGPHHTYYSISYPAANIPFVSTLFAAGGIYLVSFFVILCNYFFYFCYKKYTTKDITPNIIYVLGAILFSFLFLSNQTLHVLRERDSSNSTFVATVVAMEELSLNTTVVAKEKIAHALPFISSMNNPDGIIIFPENINVLPVFLEEKQDKKISSNLKLIIGSFTGYQFYNMYFFTPQDKKVEYYRKQLLMPIGEYSISWIDFLIEKSNVSSWSKEYSLSKHTSKKSSVQTVYPYSGIRGLIFGGSLCSENISPYIYRNATKLGATVLLNIASHAPFHGSELLSRQTLAINMVRALENGRYFITSTNYGRSSVITDEGIVSYISNTDKAGSHTNVTITIKKYITPYVSYGDYIVYISGIIISIRIIWLRKKSRLD